MTSLQIEHLSEHSHVFQDFTNSDSPNVRAEESPERTHLRHSGHRSKGIGHTSNPLGIGHTGNSSDHLGRLGLMLLSTGQTTRSSRRDSNTHRETIPL